MSAIDRAFIKAYSDESSQSAAGPRASTTAAAADGASAESVNTPTILAAPPTRRPSSRTKRSASAASIRGTQHVPTARAEPQQSDALSLAANSPAPTVPLAAAGKSKMVVGRQALKQLAETATVPTPHAAFAQDRAVAAGQFESQPAPIASATVQRIPLGAGVSRSVDEQPRAPLRAAAHPIQTSTVPVQMDPAMTPAAEPYMAGLEVDCLAWPPACNALFDCARAEFEAVAEQLTDPAGNCEAAIAVLSIDEGQGGTTVAACLARILAQKGTRVCLVDGDYRQPGLAEILGLDLERGLESVLSGEATLGEILVESLEDQLMLLPLARPLAADAVERSKLRQTVTFGELRDQFDVVLVDAGSLGAAPAARPGVLGAGVIDSVILVGRQTADIETWQRARQALVQWNVSCLGAIANRCAA